MYCERGWGMRSLFGNRLREVENSVRLCEVFSFIRLNYIFNLYLAVMVYLLTFTTNFCESTYWNISARKVSKRTFVIRDFEAFELLADKKGLHLPSKQ